MFPFPLLYALLPLLSNATPQVTLGGTTINGIELFGQDFFGGIPYAQPPTTTNRFKPPVLLSTLSGLAFDASNYGAPCLQNPVYALLHLSSEFISHFSVRQSQVWQKIA